MKIEAKVLTDIKTAKKIGEFMTGPNAFEQTWYPSEKAVVMQAPVDSIDSEDHRYWYVKSDSGEILGALGVNKNKYNTGGYEMDADYVAVHKDHRREGIATALLNAMEDFVKERKGRYIHILACDIPSYAAARAFYQRHGYKKVAEMPNYYLTGEGRVDFYKELVN